MTSSPNSRPADAGGIDRESRDIESNRAVIGRDRPPGEMALWALAVKETASWQAKELGRQAVYDKFADLNETEELIALLTIADGQVSVADKPAHIRCVGGWKGRTSAYRAYLEQVVREFCPNLRCQILLDTGDVRDRNDAIPIFAFQKPAGSNLILLPDINFLGNDFYNNRPALMDHIGYADKTCTAVFAGSTTGGRITAEVARNLSLPRLRAAAYFKDNPSITFRLAKIVQCDSDAAKQILQDAGFGGEPISWREQFRHRFIITIDGNGATCSRVFIGLRSNSVLLKYDSKHELYYFSAMNPWIHYIPIRLDSDIVSIVEAERRQPGLFRHIAEAGKEFADTFLTRSSAMRYTAMLLELYDTAFSGST